MAQGTEALRNEIEATRERIGETVDAIGYRGNIPARAKRRLSRVKDAVTGAKDSVAERASQNVPDGTQVRARGRHVANAAQRNPMGLALAGLAAGFAVGSMIPVTRKEAESIGPVAEDVKDTVKQSGEAAVERGRQVARETAGAAKRSLRSVAEETKGKTQQAAQQVAGSTRTRAQRVASGAKSGARGSAASNPSRSTRTQQRSAPATPRRTSGRSSRGTR